MMIGTRENGGRLLMRLLAAFCIVIAVVRANDNDNDESTLIQPLVDWLKETDGGFFHPNLEIKKDDLGVRYGMFASGGDIAKDETMIVVPRSILFTEGNFTGKCGSICCPTAKNLAKHMRMGKDSPYAPYINYLNAQSHGQLPSAWSDAGKALLLEVLGSDLDDEMKLPPSNAVGYLERDWKRTCKGSDDPLDQQAALLQLQRAWDEIMIPVYDMMSHRNGWWLNTKSNSVHDPNEPVMVKASRDIGKGEEIYTTYNYCEDCGNRQYGYGTPQILRDYGFVETWPQRWFLLGSSSNSRWAFELNLKMNPKTGKPMEDTIDNLEIKWLAEKKPGKKTKSIMLRQLERLRNVGEIELDMIDEDDTSIPKHELETIRTYHQAAIFAIEFAFADLGMDVGSSDGCGGDGESCDLRIRYDDLSYQPDDLYYFGAATCDYSLKRSFYGWEHHEKLSSHYQELDFYSDPKTDNTCFDISKILQMCGAYRPHYHAMVVHYTSRFISDPIRRVLWVGGGDSMLLDEIIKFQSLEFVVGLEIDQVVTRKSFKHFGTSPHFHNSKVQWWFGDAAKSLLMLPASYFGSFDMVLVDLSETITSYLVTDELDILAALGLLLKPNGILVKNELYMEKMSAISKYTLQIDIPRVPYICDQVLVFGSQQTDFLHVPLTQHETLSPVLFPPALTKQDSPEQFHMWHDYRHNVTANVMCKDNEEEEDVDLPTKQKRSPGILMIVEVEETTLNLKDANLVLQTMLNAIKSVHDNELIVQSTHVYQEEYMERSILSILLQQGYILVRTFPSNNYVALDIHFWSGFDYQESTKLALKDALGSNEYSSYRIVAGGMFGVSTWKQDEVNRGPRVTTKCNEIFGKDNDDLDIEFVMETKVSNDFLEETIPLINDEDYTVVVVCGQEKKDKCSSLDVLEKVKAATKVIPLYSCPDIMNEFDQNIMKTMKECERETLKTLMDATTTNDKLIRAVIFDASAPYSFSRVLHKISKAKKERLFDSQNLMVMATVFADSDSWRRHLMERFRKEIILHDPNFRVQVLFNSTTNSQEKSSVELDICNSGDVNFIPKLLKVVKKMEERTGLVSDVRDITGGLYVYDPNWDATYYMPQDFEQHTPLKQYMSQQPMGIQVINQMEPKNPKLQKLALSVEFLKVALKDTFRNIQSIPYHEARNMANHAQYHVSSSNDSMNGDGCIVIALWSGGSCVVLWDGRKHVDLNLFSYYENGAFVEEVEKKFQEQFSVKVTTSLRDAQPRGYGRVVNYLADLGSRSLPHWAKFKE